MKNEEIPQYEPDLVTLKKLLEHPVFVIRQLAKDVYEEDSPAAYERLRSRANGRHRFREEECKKLHQLFIALAKAFRGCSKKLDKLLRTPDKLEGHVLMPMLDCPHINLKAIIEPIGKKHGKNYFQAYDALRRRSGFTETLCRDLCSSMEHLAQEIEEQVKVSKVEAKSYPFNGNGS